jgi:hypothetical protein
VNPWGYQTAKAPANARHSAFSAVASDSPRYPVLLPASASAAALYPFNAPPLSPHPSRCHPPRSEDPMSKATPTTEQRCLVALWRASTLSQSAFAGLHNILPVANDN